MRPLGSSKLDASYEKIMRELIIPIRYLPGAAPENTYIPAEQLTQYFNASTLMNQARKEADQLLRQADEIKEAAEHDAQAIRADACQQGIIDGQAELNTMRADLIYQTVEWLIHEEELEINLAAQLEVKLRALVAHALEEFIGEQDQTEIVMRRVKSRLPHIWADEPITLRIAPEATDRAELALADTARIRLIPDSSLRSTQAMLETRLAVIHIDLDCHLAAIVSRIKHTQHRDQT